MIQLPLFFNTVMTPKEIIKLENKIKKEVFKKLSKELNETLIKNSHDFDYFIYILQNDVKLFQVEFHINEKFILKLFNKLMRPDNKNPSPFLEWIKKESLKNKINIDYSSVLLDSCLIGNLELIKFIMLEDFINKPILYKPESTFVQPLHYILSNNYKNNATIIIDFFVNHNLIDESIFNSFSQSCKADNPELQKYLGNQIQKQKLRDKLIHNTSSISTQNTITQKI